MTSKDFSSLPALPAAPSTMTDALDKGDAATAVERHHEKTRFWSCETEQLLFVLSWVALKRADWVYFVAGI